MDRKNNMTADPEKLLEYLADRLHINIRICDNDLKVIRTYAKQEAPDDRSLVTAAFLQEMAGSEGRIPYIVVVAPYYFFYASIRIGKDLFVLGPMQSRIYFECSHVYESLLSQADLTGLREKLPPQQFRPLMENILLISNAFSAEDDPVPEDRITPEQVVRENHISERTNEKILSTVTQMVFDNLETAANHNPFDEEIREMAAVERGDEDLLRQIVEETYNGNVGALSKDPLRHEKNLGIVIITISSRAAIRGGVPYEVVFSMSDRFIQELEEQTTTRDAEAVARAAEIEFTRTVRSYREAIRNRDAGKTNEYVERCKEYIFKHLHEKIRVSEIAESLAINSNYLSTIFRKFEGITITDYILRQKLVLVRNMLIYSDYTYLEITNYLCFSSQSYLGKRFQEETGMTLREFRTKYRVRAFQQEQQRKLN